MLVSVVIAAMSSWLVAACACSSVPSLWSQRFLGEEPWRFSKTRFLRKAIL
jgi:hypothetical protein